MQNKWFNLLTSSLVTVILIAGYHFSFRSGKQKSGNEEKIPVSFTSLHNHQGIQELPGGDFSNAAEKSMPAVVHIKSVQTVQTYDPWMDFWGWGRGGASRSAESSGSGVILNESGYIVTNNHVISDADKITVTLYDNRTFTAEVIGTDPSSDLGVIKINAEHLTPIQLSNSDDAKVGQWVIAVGNPFNLSSTVTAGIVSAIGRNLEIIKDQYAIESFIQTDAAVNPGNSGGALVDLEGKLVGVNTAISSPTGAYAGYAFAIPSNIVQKIVDDLIAYGTVQRVYLGLGKITVLNNLEADKNELKVQEGILIQSVNTAGSAAKAGVEVGDVITKIDGITIKNEAKLMEVIARHSPGETVKFQIVRDGKEKTLDVLLRNQKGTTSIVRKNPKLQALGIDLISLDDRTRAQYKIDNGVKVSRLYAGKVRQSTDMQEGFVILEINEEKVATPEEVADILDKAKGTVKLYGFIPNYFVNGKIFTASYSIEL
ncbi:MAG: trypsin-like peptidase domain-containing protein [Bacteroidia bacterium]|nr:trypsin-like peptidase domain-containing protein [Bacteroidia bacterium]